MKKQYDFSAQEKAFDIALQIIEDYYPDADWSFGGGTALSRLYYGHRMSFDIDIFVEDTALIAILCNNKDLIAAQLEINKKAIQASPTGITFILDDTGAKIKLDFVSSQPATNDPYRTINFLGHADVKVQTPTEIIARKIKYREKITVRDYVDFYFAEKIDQIFTKCIDSTIVDIERFIDIVDQFSSISEDEFNMHLDYMDINGIKTKEEIGPTVMSLLNFKDEIIVACDKRGEVVAFENFVDKYKEAYTAEIFDVYNIYKIDRKKAEIALNIHDRLLNYKDIYEINFDKVESAVLIQDQTPRILP